MTKDKIKELWMSAENEDCKMTANFKFEGRTVWAMPETMQRVIAKTMHEALLEYFNPLDISVKEHWQSMNDSLPPGKDQGA